MTGRFESMPCRGNTPGAGAGPGAVNVLTILLILVVGTKELPICPPLCSGPLSLPGARNLVSYLPDGHCILILVASYINGASNKKLLPLTGIPSQSTRNPRHHFQGISIMYLLCIILLTLVSQGLTAAVKSVTV